MNLFNIIACLQEHDGVWLQVVAWGVPNLTACIPIHGEL